LETQTAVLAPIATRWKRSHDNQALMSHDQNFKNLIVDQPHQAVRFFAADEAPMWTTVSASFRSAKSD